MNTNEFVQAFIAKYNAVAKDKLNSAEAQQCVKVLKETAKECGIVIARELD